jgi:hypothetical protein
MSVPKCNPGAHHLAATRRIPPARRRQRQIRFPQRAASTLCGKPGVAAGGLSGIASPVTFQHPIPNHFGIEARKHAARVVREGVRAILRGQQPVEDLHPCSGADPRIEQSAQRLVQQAPVEPDEVIVRPRVAFARCFCSLGADRAVCRGLGPSAMDRDTAITSSRGAHFATPTIALTGEAVSVNAALRLR